MDTRFTKDSAKYGSTLFYNEIKKYRDNPKELQNYSTKIELEYVCKNGMNKWGELIITPYFDINKNLTGIHGVTRDISERRKIESEKQLFNNVLEESLSEIYIFDAESLKYKTVNKGAITNIGFIQEEIQQLTPLDLFYEYTLDQFLHLIKPLTENKVEVLHFQTNNKRKNETVYPVEVHLSYQKTNNLFIAMIVDITERIKTENAIIEKTKELERFNNLMIGREIKMIALKKEVNELLKKTGENEKYKNFE